MSKKEKILIAVIIVCFVILIGEILLFNCVGKYSDGSNENGNQEVLDNPSNYGSQGNETTKQMSVISSLEEYKSDSIDNIKIDYNIIEASGNGLIDIIAYKDNEEVWKYTTGEFLVPQSEPYDFIVVVNQKLYVHILGDILVFDIESGTQISKIENIGFMCEYVYLDDNNNIYVASTNGGSAINMPQKLSIINVETNTVLNSLSLVSEDYEHLYKLKNTNDSTFQIIKIQMDDEKEIDSKFIEISKLLDTNFDIENLFN